MFRTKILVVGTALVFACGPDDSGSQASDDLGASDYGVQSDPDVADLHDVRPDSLTPDVPPDLPVDVQSDPDVVADPEVDAVSDLDAEDAGRDPDASDADAPDLGDEPDTDAVDVLSDPEDDLEDGTSVGVFGLEIRPSNVSCLAGPSEVDFTESVFVSMFGGREFTDPLAVLQEPAGSSRWYVAERGGHVRWFDASRPGASVMGFLDISRRFCGSLGRGELCGFAFHPRYPRPWEIYVSYVVYDVGFEVRVSRFLVGFSGVDLDAEEILLEVPVIDPALVGGAIAFGPDGYLYAAFGDDAGAPDDVEHGQDTETLLGTIVRIDVDSAVDDLAYVIPDTNPFAAGGGAPEIFAWGFQHPGRISFDSETGALWTVDVGETEWQEVNRVERGGNYGWPIREGDTCVREEDPRCEEFVLSGPVVAYDHHEGAAIVGGSVYRGDAIPEYTGVFLFGDEAHGGLRGVFSDPDTGASTIDTVLEHGVGFTVFGVGHDREIYAISADGQASKLERISRMVPAPRPEFLSETGCFLSDEPSVPVDAMIPFEPTAPFWSDGAVKRRWFAIPDGSQISLTGRGDFLFPPGSVLVKDFTLHGRLIETRFFVHHDDEVWAGYTYEWNEDGTDAALVSGGAVREIEDQTWLYPSSTECLECHTFGVGRTIGPEAVQLDWSITYPSGVVANQLDTIEHIGMLEESPPEVEPMLNPYGDGPIIPRARAWLHSNCSGCHRPTGPEPIPLDFRWHVPDINACNTPVREDFGLEDARIITPGDPDASVLISRISVRGPGQMPPLGSFVTDDRGVELLRQFVLSDYCESLEE